MNETSTLVLAVGCLIKREGGKLVIPKNEIEELASYGIRIILLETGDLSLEVIKEGGQVYGQNSVPLQ